MFHTLALTVLYVPYKQAHPDVEGYEIPYVPCSLASAFLSIAGAGYGTFKTAKARYWP